LINSAGYCYPEFFGEIPPEEIRGMVETNLLGPLFIARAFMKPLISQGHGQIVNIASMATFFSFVGIPAYSGSKAGLLAFSRGLKNEFARTGVSVSVVFPPDTQTPGFDRENATKPLITQKLSANGGVLSPDLVAEVILKGVAARRFQIVPGWGNWLLSSMGQHLPGCAGLFFDWQWRREP
jgi:3-dehydrosphinganine reductase